MLVINHIKYEKFKLLLINYSGSGSKGNRPLSYNHVIGDLHLVSAPLILLSLPPTTFIGIANLMIDSASFPSMWHDELMNLTILMGILP